MTLHEDRAEREERAGAVREVMLGLATGVMLQAKTAIGGVGLVEPVISPLGPTSHVDVTTDEGLVFRIEIKYLGVSAEHDLRDALADAEAVVHHD